MNGETTKAPKLGIIIPVGDSEHFIEYFCAQYFKSIHEYTGDVETLFVCNNTTRRCIDKIQNFARHNVRVYDLGECSNGISKARNHGLQQLSDDVDFVGFLDDDDALNGMCLKHLAEQLDSPADIVCFEWMMITNGSGNIIEKKLPRHSIVSSEVIVEEDLPRYLNLPRDVDYLGRCWAKFYKKKLIEKNKILFNESLSTFEDVYFLLETIMVADRVKFAPLNLVIQNYINKPASQKATFGHQIFKASLGYIAVADLINKQRPLKFRLGEYRKSQLISRYCGYLFYFSAMNFFRYNKSNNVISNIKYMSDIYKIIHNCSTDNYYTDKTTGESLIVGYLHQWGFIRAALVVCFLKVKITSFGGLSR